MRSFGRVSGPKTDRWLVRTVAGLLVTNGPVQLGAGPSGLNHARRIGVGTVATLAAIDLTYATRRWISRIYLADAAIELGWIWAWTVRGKPQR